MSALRHTLNLIPSHALDKYGCKNDKYGCKNNDYI